MSVRCAKLITKWLIDCEVVHKEEYDLYVYAAHSFMITLAPLGLTLVIGIMLGRIITAVSIIVPFMMIRKFSGGYHAKNAWVCLIISSIILSGCICVSEYIAYGSGLILGMLIAAVSLVVNSPVDSENRRLDEQEQSLYKKVTINLVVFCVLSSLICYRYGQERVGVNLAVGVILTGGLQIPCLLKRLKL